MPGEPQEDFVRRTLLSMQDGQALRWQLRRDQVTLRGSAAGGFRLAMPLRGALPGGTNLLETAEPVPLDELAPLLARGMLGEAGWLRELDWVGRRPRRAGLKIAAIALALFGGAYAAVGWMSRHERGFDAATYWNGLPVILAVAAYLGIVDVVFGPLHRAVGTRLAARLGGRLAPPTRSSLRGTWRIEFDAPDPPDAGRARLLLTVAEAVYVLAGAMLPLAVLGALVALWFTR